MSTPEIANAWSKFADTVDIAGMTDADWDHLAAYVIALDQVGLGLSAAEENVLEVGGRDGAPEFLAGELMAGVDVGLRVLSQSRQRTAPTATPPTAAPPATPMPTLNRPTSVPVPVAAKPGATDTGSELSDAEKKALGLA